MPKTKRSNACSNRSFCAPAHPLALRTSTPFNAWRTKGRADAQVFLGASYAAGIRVPQDDAEAVRWYRRAAEQEHAGGQYQLGLAYFAGRGVPRNRTEGIMWCRRAAEQGFAATQHFLALTYGLGRGVPQDYVEAALWYRRAAEQGNADAQLGLGMAYATGLGVPQDYVSAHMWLNLAAATGDEDARLWRDRIAAGITRDQITEARARAREWGKWTSARGGGTAATTNMQRVREFVLRSPGLDDDEFSDMTGVKPRQQVKQICRRLVDRGELKRVPGPEEAGELPRGVQELSPTPSGLRIRHRRLPTPGSRSFWSGALVR